jgi:hypothetical protein
LMMPVALITTTAALHRLVKNLRSSWTMAAFLAGALMMAILWVVFLIAN